MKNNHNNSRSKNNKYNNINQINKINNDDYNVLNDYNNLILSNDNYIDTYNISDVTNSSDISLSLNIYEKNISLLNEKLKEKEKDIIYLNKRLENYDTTMNEIIKLNIEISNLNEIIRNKNKTIQEFREISDISKQKFEDLVKNNKLLLEKLKDLEEENEKLKNQNNFKDELEKIQKENDELKNVLKEKNQEIFYLQKLNKKKEKFKKNNGKTHNFTYSIASKDSNNDIKELKEKNNNDKIENFLNDKKPNSFKIQKGHSFVNTKIIKKGKDIPFCNYNRNNNVYPIHHSRRGSFYLFNRNLSMKTEPSFGNLSKIPNAKEKYTTFRNMNLEPLDYSNYLLDNLQNKICNTLME